MTRETIMQHIGFMAQFDPRYAQKALRWYDRCLPWLGLLPNDASNLGA